MLSVQSGYVYNAAKPVDIEISPPLLAYQIERFLVKGDMAENEAKFMGQRPLQNFSVLLPIIFFFLCAAFSFLLSPAAGLSFNWTLHATVESSCKNVQGLDPSKSQIHTHCATDL